MTWCYTGTSNKNTPAFFYFIFFDAKLYCLRDWTLSRMNSVGLVRVMEWQAESNDHTSMEDVRGQA